jgi:hypothetical protein
LLQKHPGLGHCTKVAIDKTGCTMADSEGVTSSPLCKWYSECDREKPETVITIRDGMEFQNADVRYPYMY